MACQTDTQQLAWTA